MSAEIACPNCGERNAADQRFCGRCGTSLQKACPACGTPNPASFTFCGTCGASLQTAEPSLEGERRWATVLFGDLSGFTAFSERMDPEEVSAVIDRCMSMLGEIAEKFGGRVERVTGDEIMVVFGAPHAYEDDPERAVRAALEMQRCCAEKSDEFGGLRMRIGVNTGRVMFAPVGPASARQFTVMGDAVNVAARLQTAALPGRVFVGEETYLASRRAVRYEEVDPIHAKGKDKPVPAWVALEAEAPQARPLSEVPIVGRDVELELLTSVARRVVSEGRAHLVTVVGAPGVGKTRLTFEFERWAEVEGFAVVRGRALPYGESTGYGAFAQQVKAAAGVYETDPEEVARAKLDGLVGDVCEGDAAEVAEHIAIAVGVSRTSVLVEKVALFTSCRRLIEGLSRKSPVLMVFEDIHWADSTLLDLIEFLASRLGHAPVLLLALARPELHDVRRTWGGGLSSSTAVALEPLGTDAAKALAQRHLARFPGRETAQRLVDLAEGNPLFIEELAATIGEGEVDEHRLPTTIQAIIAARLDALPPNARSALLDASVVGKIFWRGALASLGHDDADQVLDVLERRDFVRRQGASRFEGDEEIAFKHMLIRDVAYETVPRAARRERHAQVATFLEDAARERPRESASLLAHHWKEAGEIDRALEYIELAAEGARGAGALGEAISLYDQALELMGADDPRVDSLRFRRARAMVQRGDYPGGAAELDYLLDRLSGSEFADALVHRSTAAFWLGDATTLRVRGAQAIALGDERGDTRMRSLGVGYLSMADQMDGALDIAMERSDEAISGVESFADSGALLFIQAGALRYWAGDAARAVEYLEKAFTVGSAERYAEPALAGGANLALALFGLGRHHEAEQVARKVNELAPELELVPRLQGRALNIWAGGLYDAGEFAAARELNERAIDMSARASFPVVDAQARADLLFALIADGEIGAAESSLPAAREAAGKVGGFHKWLLDVRLTQAEAEIALGAGRLDDAADIAMRGLSREFGRRPKYEIAARITLASVMLSTGKAGEAVDQLRAALEGARQLSYPRWIWRSAGALSDALATIGDDTGAEVASDEAKRAVSDFAEQLAPERREAFLRRDTIAR